MPESTSISTRHLILGAGVSGLSFADRLAGGDYLICEADSQIGGYCKTVVQDGFTWDYSGHFFHFRDPEIEVDLVSRMPDQRVLKINKDSRIWWKGALIDFPFQKNIHQLPKEDFIAALHDLYFRSDGGFANFEQMLYAKFGRSIAEMFLVPYNRKLYATDLSTLDVDAMGRFFPYADIDEVIRQFKATDNRSYNSHFTYPEGGAIQYVHALMSGVDEARLSLNERIEQVDVDTKTARTDRGRTIVFEHLISSAPFPALLRMTGAAHEPSDYSWNRVLVFNLGFDRKGPEGIHWIYFPQPDVTFYRVGFYDNIFGTDRMSMYVEVGLEAEGEVDVAETKRAVLKDLRRCGIVQGHELVSSHSILLDPAYVHITKRSIAEVARVKAELAERGVYSIGRYGSWTYCSIEDNIIEARALADRLG